MKYLKYFVKCKTLFRSRNIKIEKNFYHTPRNFKVTKNSLLNEIYIQLYHNDKWQLIIRWIERSIIFTRLRMQKKNRKFPKIKRTLLLWHSLDLSTLINSIIAAYPPCCPTVELRLRGMTLISRRNELISTKLVYSLHREENCLFTTMLWFNPAQKFLNREHLGIHEWFFFFQTKTWFVVRSLYRYHSISSYIFETNINTKSCHLFFFYRFKIFTINSSRNYEINLH